MANKLKIYACSGIEDKKEPGLQKFWTDGYKVLNNTQAANTILVQINLLRSELQNLPLTDEERIERYNAIDIYTVCLHFVRMFADDKNKLDLAGSAIGELIKQGAFNNTSLSIREREDAVNNLIARVCEMIETQTHFKKNDVFNEWWDKNVKRRIKVGFNDKERKAIRAKMAKAVEGIGVVDESWKQNAELSDYLLNGSEYFLYLYFTPEQLKSLPRVFRKKAEKQQVTFDYCKALFVDVYGSEEEMKDIIRTGIINYFGQTPEYVCDATARGEVVKPVGFVFMGLAGAAAVKAFISLIASILTFVAAVISSICSMVASIKIAEYKAINEDLINNSTPAPDDYDGYNFKDMLKGGSSSWLTYAVLAIGAVILLKNSK